MNAVQRQLPASPEPEAGRAAGQLGPLSRSDRRGERGAAGLGEVGAERRLAAEPGRGGTLVNVLPPTLVLVRQGIGVSGDSPVGQQRRGGHDRERVRPAGNGRSAGRLGRAGPRRLRHGQHVPVGRLHGDDGRGCAWPASARSAAVCTPPSIVVRTGVPGCPSPLLQHRHVAGRFSATTSVCAVPASIRW